MILMTPGSQQCSRSALPSIPGQLIHTHNAGVPAVRPGGVLVHPALPGGVPTAPAQPAGVLVLQPVDHALSSACRPRSGRTLAPSAVPPSSRTIPPPPSHGSFLCQLTMAWIDIPAPGDFLFGGGLRGWSLTANWNRRLLGMAFCPP